MINEVIFFSILFLNLTFMYVAKRLGRQTLLAIFILNIFLSIIFAPSVITFFGLPISLSALFYAPLFIIIQIIHDTYGHQESLKNIYIGFGTMLCFFILSGIGIYFIGHTPETVEFTNALNLIFNATIQVLVASLTAYAIGQHINVHLYDFLKNKMKHSPLWFKHNVTNTTAQAMDSIIFYPLAFAGTLSIEIIIAITLTGWVIKSFVAGVMTPIAYLTKLTNEQK